MSDSGTHSMVNWTIPLKLLIMRVRCKLGHMSASVDIMDGCVMT